MAWAVSGRCRSNRCKPPIFLDLRRPLRHVAGSPKFLLLTYKPDVPLGLRLKSKGIDISAAKAKKKKKPTEEAVRMGLDVKNRWGAARAEITGRGCANIIIFPCQAMRANIIRNLEFLQGK